MHATDYEKQVATLLWQAWSDGAAYGRRDSEAFVRQYREEARELRRQLHERDNPWRTTHGGRQIVQVGGYAYTWNGEQPLKIGDQVMIPGNWLFKNPSEGIVNALGTDYQGDLQAVMHLIAQVAEAG